MPEKEKQALEAYSRWKMTALELRRSLGGASYGEVLRSLSLESSPLPRAPVEGREEQLERARALDVPEEVCAMLIGCARVSTVDQNLASQRDALTEGGIFDILWRAALLALWRGALSGPQASQRTRRRARLCFYRRRRRPDAHDVQDAREIRRGRAAPSQRRRGMCSSGNGAPCAKPDRPKTRRA